MAIDTQRRFIPIAIAVVTVSDTRTAADDTSGDILCDRIEGAGHRLAARTIVRDDAALIARSISSGLRRGSRPPRRR